MSWLQVLYTLTYRPMQTLPSRLRLLRITFRNFSSAAELDWLKTVGLVWSECRILGQSFLKWISNATWWPGTWAVWRITWNWADIKMSLDMNWWQRMENEIHLYLWLLMPCCRFMEPVDHLRPWSLAAMTIEYSSWNSDKEDERMLSILSVA